MPTHYTPIDNGFGILASDQKFNRVLYGSHKNDAQQERYFTLAGDVPIFMGAATDYTQNLYSYYAKNGLLMSGLALTHGKYIPYFYSKDADLSSNWFHNSGDIVTSFKNGYMEYKLSQFSPWFPNAKVEIKAFPLLDEDGFLVHYNISTDQRVIFCAGFGGITDFIGRFEYNMIKEREFSESDCSNNSIICGKNRAKITGPLGVSLWIGSSFPTTVKKASAKSFTEPVPSLFLQENENDDEGTIAKMYSVIEPNTCLDGYLVVIRNEDESVLDKWLNHPDPIKHLKRKIRLKHNKITMNTPDAMFNQTVPSTTIGLDASWHQNTFYHGAHGYHTPFLGWRGWYSATDIGWNDRVRTAIKAHFATQVLKADGEEKVWHDGGDRPDLDHEGTQYHHLVNSTGYLPALLHRNDIYNMQEVAISMMFHYFEHECDLKLGEELFDQIALALAWEERILDPDNDGLYQNFLNTWISDGHSYNGGGCAQSSSYNYQANVLMAKLAGKLKKDSHIFEARAAKILAAIQEKLWLKSIGVVAEYIDTIGNKLVHPSPELSTIYLAIECETVDQFQAYRMLQFTEKKIVNERSLNRNGRLVFSANWLPRKYSTCGIFPSENACLALAYFQLGLKEKALEIFDGLVDAYFCSQNPGLVRHVITAQGGSDLADLDFTDTSSTYLRMVIEGLWGIRFHLLDDLIDITPCLHGSWDSSSLKLKDLSLNYYRNGKIENFDIYTANSARKRIKIPLKSTILEDIWLNGEPIDYKIEANINSCAAVVETTLTGRLELQVFHGETALPELKTNNFVTFSGNELLIEVTNGEIVNWTIEGATLSNVKISADKMSAKVEGEPGYYSCFVQVKAGDYLSYLALDFTLTAPLAEAKPKLTDYEKIKHIDISKSFNCDLPSIHKLEYRSPRPEGYSIGVRLNGRYAWEWNHCGHNALEVDERQLRAANGLFKLESGLSFVTPGNGPNVVCASIWDNFPTAVDIPLKGKGSELVIFFIGTTNAMQNGVENGSFMVSYTDGSKEEVHLIHPQNFDDWLVPALQRENESFYFSNYNHGLVQRISLNPDKELAKLTIQAVANEVIIGVLGVALL